MDIDGHFLKLFENFLSNRYRRVVLNGQASSWADVKADFPQVSILGPLFFLIYINDLSENLKLTAKLFADDTSIFHVVKDPSTSNFRMGIQMEITKTNHPNIIFNGKTVQKSANQKHHGLILDEKVTFNDHATSKLTTVNKLTSTFMEILSLYAT